MQFPLSRREFARQPAAGTGAFVAFDRCAAAEEPSSATPAPAPPPRTSVPTADESAERELAALPTRSPGEPLTEEMRAGIMDGLRCNRRQAQQLRNVGPANADEPAFVFRAYRKVEP